MAYDIVKVCVSAALIVLISELSKRSTMLAAILASLPLVSVIAMVWLYVETGSLERIAALSSSIFWLVLPSLVLFCALPFLIKRGWGFWPSLGVSTLATVFSYAVMVVVLRYYNVQL
jgi:uncharacterized membrane protein (GlpM family)